MKKILFLLLISSAAFGQYNGAPKLNQPPQGDETGMLVRQIPQDIDRIGFNKTISNNVDSDWGALITGIGAGMDVDQTSGNLVITSGTTARSETIIRSTESWQGGIRLRARSTLSQRIANQNFFVELVDVIGDGLTYSIGSATAITVTIPSNPFTAQNVGQSMYIGVFSGTGTFLSGRYPIASVSGNDVTFTVSGFAVGTGTCSLFGHSYYQLHYTGTTATNANFDTQRNGYATGATNATINTTATPGHLAIITGNDLIATFSDALIATATGVQVLNRANRHENIPDDKSLRLQIRIANGSTAPASTTTWTIGFVSVSHYSNTDISIQDVRPMSFAQALPVELVRGVATATQPVSGTVAATSTLAAGATTNPNKLEDAVSATGDNGMFNMGIRRDALTISSSATGDYNEISVNRFGANYSAGFRTSARTYSATASISPEASATDIMAFFGNASSTVQINKIRITGSVGTAGSFEAFLIKRSTANTGGTSSNFSVALHESSDAVNNSTPIAYTANPTPGTSAGTFRRWYQYLPTSSSGPADEYVVEFTDNGKPIILSGTSQGIVLNLNGVTLVAANVIVNIEWTEF
jgi:hypothetical protein